MGNTDLRTLLKRVVELVMPNLRAYYRMPVKGRVTATYASAGKYWADVQPLRADESVDEDAPVIPKVEIPIFWGGAQRGLVCPPAKGTYVVVSYFDGDPDYPWISHVRWHVNAAPECEVGGLIIQQTPGVHIKIDADSNIIHVTPANCVSEIGTDTSEEIGRNKSKSVGGDETIAVAGNRSATVGGDESLTVSGVRSTAITGDDGATVGGSWTVVVSGAATIQAPTINLVGDIGCTGAGGDIGQTHERAYREHEGSYTLTGPASITGATTIAGDVVITGNVTINGDLVTTGNSDAATRSGGAI
ncbi:MAG: hypothetical protein PWQ57_917 [Desulfovibrionales bacterium]|nr:hypothetical protein [Desulfovibrionales bacterium]